ncbi:MAG: hypothetical protein HZB44_07520 [Actinobacteria bacterium]|nr:hypothetical protein [Actinomycetota bacterium]
MGLAAAMGILALAGWITGFRFLTSIRSAYFPMPPSTAIGLLLTAGAMTVAVYWPENRAIRATARMVSAVLMILAFIIITEAFRDFAPGIEERLFGLKGELNGIPIGRMSPIAAVIFFSLNLAVLTFRFNGLRVRTSRGISAVISLAVLLVGSITTLGYLYGTPLLYGGGTRPVAPTAGFALALLGAAMIAAAGNDAWPLKFFVGQGVRARMLRSTLPIIVALIVIDGWVEAVGIVEFEVNPVLVSALSALFFVALAAALIARSAQKIGGAVDEANARRDQAEELMLTLNRELERSNAELEQFAYVASHDLQEPLRMVSSYMQLLENRYSERLDQDAKDFIGFAVDGSRRMQMMIRDLLLLSRVSTKAKPFIPVESSLSLDLALENLSLSIEENDAVITHDPMPKLMADPSQLIQLFQNLIGNAIKFHGEKEPRIHVAAERNAENWVFSVSDNGIGFDETYADRIFVIFQRLHGRNEYEGSGLGLALCKKIVERHGGHIWAESTPGRGSVFYFTMPAREEEDGAQ